MTSFSLFTYKERSTKGHKYCINFIFFVHLRSKERKIVQYKQWVKMIILWYSGFVAIALFFSSLFFAPLLMEATLLCCFVQFSHHFVDPLMLSKVIHTHRYFFSLIFCSSLSLHFVSLLIPLSKKQLEYITLSLGLWRT